MKLRSSAPSFLAVLLLAVGTMAAACGGGGDASLEEYFQKLDANGEDIDQQFTALRDQFETTFAEEPTEEETIQAARDFYSAYVSIVGDSVAQLEGIEPPGEAKAAHEEFVEAMRASGAVFEDISSRAAGSESLSELQDVFTELDSPESGAVFQRFVDACLALQGIADSNSIDVDLDCEG